VLGLIALPLLSGCTSPAKIRSPERFDRGYVIVLPGIEGASPLNTNIAKGLRDGGLPAAIEVYDWTAGTVLFPVNLRALNRNRKEARRVAGKIVDYQNRYPNRPVHIIGHSGGGGIAVLALESLPAGRQVTSAILLAPAIAPDYDLREALSKTQYGIWNFWSPHDIGFLKAGTTIMGTIEGRHTTAAGAKGFVRPWGLVEEDRRLYESKLHQQRYTKKMSDYGHRGGHTGWANRRFVAHWLTPLIYRQYVEQAKYARDRDLTRSGLMESPSSDNDPDRLPIPERAAPPPAEDESIVLPEEPEPSESTVPASPRIP
jgi:pimeloyl-ACP methyl ester carboxylesterase